MRASALASALGGRLHGPDRELRGVASLHRAGPGDLAFCEGALPDASAAGAVLASAPGPSGVAVIGVPDPRAAFIRAVPLLLGVPSVEGVMPGAHVHPTARLGARVTIHPGAVVGADCEIGDDCVLFPNAVLYPRTVLGRGVRVHAGAVLGADGFSYHPTDDGLLKMPHLGRVVVEDGVEIGANTCIDRAALDDTVIGAGSKLDNLVQVGHNSQVGRAVLLAGQVGLSGSVTLEDGAVLGGQAGVADHRRVGAGAQVGAQSGVGRDLPPGGRYLGTPARPVRATRRVWAAARRLPDLLREVRDLGRRVAALESDADADAPDGSP